MTRRRDVCYVTRTTRPTGYTERCRANAKGTRDDRRRAEVGYRRQSRHYAKGATEMEYYDEQAARTTCEPQEDMVALLREDRDGAIAENAELRQRVSELERTAQAVALNADKMAFMREFVLQNSQHLANFTYAHVLVDDADKAWNAMVAACEVKP